MTSNTSARRRSPTPQGDVSHAPSNSNSGKPIVTLEATGDGTLLYRALARVLVRGEIFATAIPADASCEAPRAA